MDLNMTPYTAFEDTLTAQIPRDRGGWMEGRLLILIAEMAHTRCSMSGAINVTLIVSTIRVLRSDYALLMLAVELIHICSIFGSRLCS